MGIPKTVKQKLKAAKTEMFRTTFLGWCKANKLPPPYFEWRFHDTRMWRFDVAWPNPFMVALEVHGGVWMRKGHHTSGQGFLDDREKVGEAIKQGWKVLEVAPSGKHPQTLYSPEMLLWLKAVL